MIYFYLIRGFLTSKTPHKNLIHICKKIYETDRKMCNEWRTYATIIKQSKRYNFTGLSSLLNENSVGGFVFL